MSEERSFFLLVKVIDLEYFNMMIDVVKFFFVVCIVGEENM